MSEEDPGPWSRPVRDRWFYAALAASTLAVVAVLSAFFTPLLFAVVVVTVSWPLNLRLRAAVGGRPVLGAVLTTGVLFFAVFGPIGTILGLFLVDAVGFVQQGVLFVQGGGLEDFLGAARHWLVQDDGFVARRIAPWLPEGFDPLTAVGPPLQQGVLALLNAAGAAIPRVLNGAVALSIDAAIFLFAVLSLYAEGPRVLAAAQRLSPMDDAYERRLFEVFGEFANNMVVGALATAGIQGVVAAVGYAIAGAERVAFLAILTGLFSFVPFVGTAVVWVPVAVWVGSVHGVGWGVFLAIWSVVFTGTADNVVRPLFLRGSSDIHPLLIFLAVFGGLQWLGLAGVLLGPVLVAIFLALYRIYCEDFLGIPTAPRPRQPSLAERALRRLGWISEDA